MSATSAGPASALAQELEAHGLGGARLALVLGSGLGPVADALEDPVAVPFDGLETMPSSAVPGHAGRFVRGRLGGEEILVQQGRLHVYEGHSAQRITRSVRAFAHLGIRGVVLTNAAGALTEDWRPPLLMRITDHLNLQAHTALLHGEAGRGCPYDPALGEILDAAARESGVTLEAGVYVGLQGPSYETPAEVRRLARMGAHAVGMSTVGEASVAYASGLRVLGVSCIANPGAGLGGAAALDHDEVVEAGREGARELVRLLVAAAPRLSRALGS